MANEELVKKILVRMISEYDGNIESMNLPDMRTAAEREAEETERHERVKRLAAMEEEVYSLFEIVDQMDQSVQDQEEDSYSKAREEACRMLFNRLTFEQQKTIRDQRRAKRSPDGGSLDRPTWTAERKRELDQTVTRGKSGIYGMRLRQRNGWKDPGNYAGKVCLITRHGWNPIVMPGGVERFLRDQGLWEKYENHWPTNSKQVPFQRGDRFYVEWERLEDGTRSFITMVAR